MAERDCTDIDDRLRDLHERLKAEGRVEDARTVDTLAWALASAETERDWAEAKVRDARRPGHVTGQTWGGAAKPRHRFGVIETAQRIARAASSPEPGEREGFDVRVGHNVVPGVVYVSAEDETVVRAALRTPGEPERRYTLEEVAQMLQEWDELLGPDDNRAGRRMVLGWLRALTDREDNDGE